MRKVNIFINANFSKNSIQAQDRDGKHYALFLDEKKFNIIGYATDRSIDLNLHKKNNIKIYYCKNKLTRIFKTIYILIFKKINFIISGKAFWPELIFFLVNKIFRGKNILVLVNQIPYLWEKFDLKVFEKLVSYTDEVIAISEKVGQSFEKAFDKKTTLIPLFYKIKERSIELNSKRNIKKIICVGSMVSRKRPFVFADLAKSLPKYQFTWIGKGYYYDWIKEKKEDENISNLKLIPKLLQKELFDELSTSDLFFFPSIHEGFPNVVLEAMSCGVPVLSYNSFGPDAVENNFNGIVIDNIFESKKLVEKIMENELILNKMKKNAIESARKYDGKILNKKLESLLKKTD